MVKQSAQQQINKPSGAGGQRAGAGRKAQELGKARTFRLPKPIDDWLAKQQNMTGTIAQALEVLKQKQDSE